MDSNEARKLPGVARVYENDEIAVLWEAALCIHVGACFRAAPKVFKPRERPWVDVDAGTTDEIEAAVDGCPTGALRFIHKLREGTEVEVQPMTIEARPNGPLYIRGRVRIVDKQRGIDQVETRVALCRCGRSQNKPFCDGSHNFPPGA